MSGSEKAPVFQLSGECALKALAQNFENSQLALAKSFESCRSFVAGWSKSTKIVERHPREDLLEFDMNALLNARINYKPHKTGFSKTVL